MPGSCLAGGERSEREGGEGSERAARRAARSIERRGEAQSNKRVFVARRPLLILRSSPLAWALVCPRRRSIGAKWSCAGKPHRTRTRVDPISLRSLSLSLSPTRTRTHTTHTHTAVALPPPPPQPLYSRARRRRPRRAAAARAVRAPRELIRVRRRARVPAAGRDAHGAGDVARRDGAAAPRGVPAAQGDLGEAAARVAALPRGSHSLTA